MSSYIPSQPATPQPAYGSMYDPSHVDLRTKQKKKKRVFMWTFLVIQALFLLWIIFGIQAVVSTPSEAGGVLTQEEADTAKAAGGTIGVILIVGFWATVDFILVVGWAVVRLARR